MLKREEAIETLKEVIEYLEEYRSSIIFKRGKIAVFLKLKKVLEFLES